MLPSLMRKLLYPTNSIIEVSNFVRYLHCREMKARRDRPVKKEKEYLSYRRIEARHLKSINDWQLEGGARSFLDDPMKFPLKNLLTCV